MPLESGKSRAAFEHNLKTEMEAGKPKAQALAIAYSKQRGDSDELIAKCADALDTLSGRMDEMARPNMKRFEVTFRKGAETKKIKVEGLSELSARNEAVRMLRNEVDDAAGWSVQGARSDAADITDYKGFKIRRGMGDIFEVLSKSGKDAEGRPKVIGTWPSLDKAKRAIDRMLGD